MSADRPTPARLAAVPSPDPEPLDPADAARAAQRYLGTASALITRIVPPLIVENEHLTARVAQLEAVRTHSAQVDAAVMLVLTAHGRDDQAKALEGLRALFPGSRQ